MRGFGRIISYEKFLREPMTKDFFDIFKFLIAQLDPLWEVEGKIEDEVPLIMRRLKYPVEVNKSKLQSICGPNTWPQLLGVLDWLISLIQVNDALIDPVAECKLGLADNDVDNEGDHHMLRTLHENYLQFLSGKDDHSVEERLRQIYEERLAALQFEIDRLQEQTLGMETQLHEFRSEHERLLETQAAPKDLEVEADRLRSVIQAQDAKAQRLEEDALALEAEHRAQLGEVENLEQRSRQLQEQVESQAYSKKDIERLKCERAHLRRMLEDLKMDAEKAEQGVWELGIEESRLEEAISRTVRFVNDKAEANSTTFGPSSSSVNALDSEAADTGEAGLSGQDLLIDVDLTKPTDALSALDFNDLAARVQRAIAARGEATRREEATVHEVLEEQRVVQEEFSEKDRECQRLKTRLEQLTRRREELRVWSESQLDEARRTVEATEDAVRAASIGTAAPSLRDAAEVDELRLRLSELNTRREGERANMEEQIRRAQEARDQNQANVQKEMQLTLEAVEKMRDDVEKRVTEMSREDQKENQPHNAAPREKS
jgi:SMC interacting uncharacterized protein involved in chromosome segregation